MEGALVRILNRPRPIPKTVEEYYYIQRSVWSMIRNAPVRGVGIGNFQFESLGKLDLKNSFYKSNFDRLPRYEHTANILTEIGAELGLVGIVLFLLLLVMAIMMGISGSWKDEYLDRDEIIIFVGLGSALLATLVAGCASFSWFFSVSSLVWVVVTGLWVNRFVFSYSDNRWLKNLKSLKSCWGNSEVKNPQNTKTNKKLKNSANKSGSKCGVMAMVWIVVFFLSAIHVSTLSANYYKQWGTLYLGKLLPSYLQQAEEKFRLSATLYPGDDEVFFLLGLTLERLKKHDDARLAYSESLRLSPYNAEYAYYSARLNIRIGLLREGVSELRRLRTFHPRYIEAYRLEAAVLMLETPLQNLQRAADVLEEALKIQPPDFLEAQLHYDLGELLQKRRNYEDALRHYDQVLKLAPKTELARMVREKRAKTIEARERLKKGLPPIPVHGEHGH